MDTAEQVVSDALQEILVQADEQSIQATDMQAGIRYLNRMVNEWAARGMPLGFTNITKVSDFVTVPDGALGAIVSNLAIRLAPQFDAAIPIELAAAARSGMDAVRDLTVTSSATQMPGTMPVGSGNEGFEQGFERFYPETNSETMEDEGNRVVNLETNT
jgi:hypothetical protein